MWSEHEAEEAECPEETKEVNHEGGQRLAQNGRADFARIGHEPEEQPQRGDVQEGRAQKEADDRGLERAHAGLFCAR